MLVEQLLYHFHFLFENRIFYFVFEIYIGNYALLKKYFKEKLDKNKAFSIETIYCSSKIFFEVLMTKTTDSFDEQFWEINPFHPSKSNPLDDAPLFQQQPINIFEMLKKTTTARRESFNAETFLFPIDETEEFHDPFSDLSLYLSRRIKKEILKETNPQKWSKKIQTLLIKEILPDFTKKFPRYRLGNAALQKTWSKVLHYLELIYGQKEALQPNGKLNVAYMIKENLKNHLKNRAQLDLHPYNQAHGLAIKISECIAAVDGERYKLDELTKMIWGMQKHLIPKNTHFNAPQIQYDQLDKFIVRCGLETIATNPNLGSDALAASLKKQIQNIKQLQRIRSLEDLIPSLSAILASKLYPSLSIHTTTTKEDLAKISLFIRAQIHQHYSNSGKEDENNKVVLCNQILFLSKLAFQIPLEVAKKNLKTALNYVHNLTEKKTPLKGPVLKQDVYQFIESELNSIPGEKTPEALETVLSRFEKLLQEAINLPILAKIPPEALEVLIWKIFHEEKDLTGKIPSYMKETIVSELAGVHIDNCDQPFQKIIQSTLHYLKKIRDMDITDLDEKLKLWTLQNDMLCSNLSFHQDSHILRIIKETWEEKNLAEFSSRAENIINQVFAKFLKQFPSLGEWSQNVKQRIVILFKYFWYTTLATGNETAYDRFIKWHFNEMIHSQDDQFIELHFTTLEQIIENLTPLAPFDLEYCRSLFPWQTNKSKCQ